MRTSQYWSVMIFIPALTLLSGCSSNSDNSSQTGNTDNNPITYAEEPFDPNYPSDVDNYEGVNGDNTPETSGVITLDEEQSRTLWPIGDIDYVKVDLNTGTTYEFSANHLCVPCDTYMSLYDTDGITQLDVNDDYLGLDSRLSFTPPTDGTYYLKIESFKEAYRVIDPNIPQDMQNVKSEDYGVSKYTLSARIFTDGDADGFSSYYDCNDADSSIYPWAIETDGDGIDQNCSNIDQLASATADSFEPDNDPATAKPIYMTNIGLWELQFQHTAWAQNARTIEAPGEIDYFTFTLGPKEGAYLNMHKGSFPQALQLTLYDSDGLTVLSAPTPPNDWPSEWVANTSDADKTFYVSYEVADGLSTAWYVPALYSAGFDYDDDGYYTRDWGSVRDCNGQNPSIYPGAGETAGDGVDSNCNGDDDT